MTTQKREGELLATSPAQDFPGRVQTLAGGTSGIFPIRSWQARVRFSRSLCDLSLDLSVVRYDLET